MNNDLISREALKKTFENLASDDYNEPIWYQQTVFETIDNAPTVEERPKGKWILHRKDLRVWFECSNCGAYNGGFETEYCPICGADMKEADND